MAASTASTESKLLRRRAIELPVITGPLGFLLLYQGLESWSGAIAVWMAVAASAGGAGLLMDRLAGDWEMSRPVFYLVFGLALVAVVAVIAFVPDINYELLAGVFTIISGAVLAVPAAIELRRRRAANEPPPP